MRIRVDEPEGADVEAIYLDNKRLAMCVEADDEEGWVKVMLPPKNLAPKEIRDVEWKPGVPFSGTAFVGDPIDVKEWQEKTLHGEVEIVMREVEGLEDEGLDL